MISLSDIDFPAIFLNTLKARNKEEAQYHVYKGNRKGGSAVYRCNFKLAWKEAGLEMPKVRGIKAEKGGMFVGKIWHEDILQPIYRAYFQSEQFKKDYPQYADLIYGEEIYVTTKLGSSEIVSPIDIAFVTEPGYIKVKMEFKNVFKEVLMKHPDATWVAIFDIKSAASRFAFTHLLRNGLNNGYKGQGHVYMDATGLKEIGFLITNKANGKMKVIPCEWDYDFWDGLVSKDLRVHALADQIKKGEVLVVPSDFTYCESDDDYECRYCPLSETDEDWRDINDPHLFLVKPCEHACMIVRKEALAKFHVGDKFKRGLSHITIEEIDGDLIISRNKSGTVYTDTIYNALKSFEEMP